MKKRNTVIASILILVALVATPIVYAGPGGRGGRHGGGHREGGMMGAAVLGALHHAKEELGLSEQQTDEIKSIFRNVREQNAQYREQLKGGFNAIQDALLKNPNDLAAAQALMDQQNAAERAMKANLLAATSKALNVLTADQRAKLSEMIEERKARRANR